MAVIILSILLFTQPASGWASQVREKEASFCKSYAKKHRLPESWSSHPKPAPSQTGSCSLCCPEKAVFSLGFISFEPLAMLSSPCTCLPREGGSSSVPCLILSAAALPASHGVERRALPGPHTRARGSCPPSSVSGMPRPPFHLCFHSQESNC